MVKALFSDLSASSGIEGRAASYVRMSSEKQNYSTSHQRTKVAEYAVGRSMQVIREYADDGWSGLLGVRGRPGLSKFIADVQSGAADFSIIIVYDVSRWGRFEDVDEAAYYEYTCRLAGITTTANAGPHDNVVKCDN